MNLPELVELYSMQLDNAKNKFLLAELIGDIPASDEAISDIDQIKTKIDELLKN